MHASRIATAALLLAVVALAHAVAVSRNDPIEEVRRSDFGWADLMSTVGVSKRVIGPVATVQLQDHELAFAARVDTGARRCSLHADAWEVVDGSATMAENVGKTIRFRVANHRGDTSWISRRIAEVALVRTSEKAELRYLVPLTLECEGARREVLVSLNDRSKMTYAMLLGRNFLTGRFIVDVEQGHAGEELLATNP